MAIALGAPSWAKAQACCASAGALTPGRLSPHERALVGAQAQANWVPGAFDARGDYATTPSGSAELDLEQDVFASVRLLRRLQLGVLLPIIETHRKNRDQSAFGGGIGDLNLNARYDFFLAGRALYIPGIALLGGVTLPTGTPVESADHALATDATGLGATQGNLGLALEQLYGRWLFGITGLVAVRAKRHVEGLAETLAPQWTAIASAGYTFAHEAALGAALTYSVEGRAKIDGATQPGTARRRTLLTVYGLLPLTDHLRMLGAVLWDPPVDDLGKNQTQNLGLRITALYSWS